MRPVSGEELVTAALQSSLARAQKNFKFNRYKQLRGAGDFSLGKKDKATKAAGQLSFSANLSKSKNLKFQSEFDLWKEQASAFTFTSEGYTNGVSIPDGIECLNATIARLGDSNKSIKSGRSSSFGTEALLQIRNGGDRYIGKGTAISEKGGNYGKQEDKSKKTATAVKTENSFELLKKIKDNRKEKKKLTKFRKRLLKGGYSVEEAEKLIEQAKASGKGVGAILQKLRNTISPNSEGTILKQQQLAKIKKDKMKDISENGDLSPTGPTVKIRPGTPSQLQGNPTSPSSMNGGGNQSGGGSSNNSQHQLPQPKRTLYPREKIIPGYVDKMPVGAGFFNMGNSCYLNASLQAIFHVPAFINWLKHDMEHRKHCQDSANCTICAMKKTLDAATTSCRQHMGSSAIRPVEILNRLRSICRHFSHGRQEDAHEFLRYLFESMERSYLAAINCQRLDNRSKETNPLSQIFGGYVRTEVTCLKCHYVSTTFQPTAELQLDIRHVTTLEDAISNHFKKERLDNNDYKCEKCRTISQATKQFSLELPPIVLCLQLKRFTLYGTKIAKRIHCNQHLDMSKYMHKSKQLNGYSNLRYRLAALVTHLGSSPNCGHYTAIAQAANGNFYQFDDTMVQQVTLSNALNNDAYVIIYEMDSKPKKSPESPPKTAATSASGYNNKLGYPSSTASSSGSSTSLGSIFPKKLPPISKIPSTSKLSQDSGFDSALAPKENRVLGPGANNGSAKPGLDRKTISYGISNSSTMGNINGATKINVLKSGIALTNSSKSSNSTSSGPSSNFSCTNTLAQSTESKSDKLIKLKLVPYNDDENEESDKDESCRTRSPNCKRLSSPENHKRQASENGVEKVSSKVPSSPKANELSHQSSLPLVNNFKKEHVSDKSVPSTSKQDESNNAQGQTKDSSNKRKSSEDEEATSHKPRSHKRRSSSSGSSSSRSTSSSSDRGKGSQSKRKRDEEAFHSPSERKSSSSYHAGTDHNSETYRREKDHRDSHSQERDRERRRNRNPSPVRSRSPSGDYRDKRGIDSDHRVAENGSTTKFDVSRLKQDNSIIGWNGQRSALSRSMEEDRKRSNERTLDDEYDDEFDKGRTKKVRRSLSVPKDTDSGTHNRFQGVEDRKKQLAKWSSIADGNGSGSKGSSSGSMVKSKSWVNGDVDDSSRYRRNFSSRSSSSNGNNGSRPRHSSSNSCSHPGNYSRNNSHGRSPFRNGHHASSGGHYRSQSHNSYHHNNANKVWTNDRNRH